MKKIYTNFLCRLFSLVLLYLFCINNMLSAQNQVNWDDKSSVTWPKETRLIEIKSTKDATVQKSYLYSSTRKTKSPLIISLHTWGGNYAQRDPLLKYCIAADVNYLHPDFRGPNNKPEAAGSELVSQDIDDAIQWALDSLQVDMDQIHVVGVSGGGFATALSYMKSKHPIKSFHAFVGIYNLEDWYYESLGRKNAYAKDIIAITGGTANQPNFAEAKKRSVLLMSTPTKQRKQASLHLYVGLHDGYTGSVPISHSLELYNKVVLDFDKHANKALISLEDRYTLLKRRSSPNFSIISQGFMGRDIIYQKQYQDKVKIIVFDGGHEMPEANLLPYIF
ncbi:prolyl oligopeptidase family serine peptidase [Sphingobacterium sp. DK4209]|uniref:Prolyl oligopeptidase family serine peptidase n=1 Tax=Sphingobacterium zhuxiongii TaxID=2662364 RepID=A0A5Q0QAY9_9SPHI|nr:MULTISPECIES: prolyl oligopeptidase family serine peptidase [unclassified Sphingobacterium]MVZ66569.1 prolyl oligopeptidase family serine peptidase [Sphingobacterium sp. DK4209]QGA26753.1 prolyl oligopeptidase family serine peptidase [Sphingobacterium sp. dk4302]